MKAAKRNPATGTVRGWKAGQAILERWRKSLASVEIELKQPRMVDFSPMEFVSGKPLQPEAEPSRRFRGQVIYVTRM